MADRFNLHVLSGHFVVAAWSIVLREILRHHLGPTERNTVID